MAYESMTIKLKKQGNGYGLYIQKDDLERFGLKVGDRFNFVVDSANPTNGIMAKSINFNPRQILEVINKTHVVENINAEREKRTLLIVSHDPLMPMSLLEGPQPQEVLA